MGRVHRRGHEVGFHAGFGTSATPSAPREEFAQLRAVAERDGVGPGAMGRAAALPAVGEPAHVAQLGRGRARLRLHARASPRRSASGPGRATSTAVFDLVARRPLALRERPFQVMDVTLFDYMGLSHDEAEEAVLEIASECRRAKGTLTLLWHNSTLPMAAQRRWYEGLTAALAQASSSS